MTEIPAAFHDLLGAKKAFANLATVMPDGSPQVTPVWFDQTNGRIRVNTAKGRVKARNMAEGSRVALSILDPDNPYRYLQIRGRVARVTEDGAVNHIDSLAKKYLGKDIYPWHNAKDTRVIYEIAEGRAEGDRGAAEEAFRRMGEVAGDAIAQAITLLDGLVVIGGGIAGAHRQFLPALVAEMNGTYLAPNGERFRRLIPRAFNLEDPMQLEEFLKGETRKLSIPGSARTVQFDGLPRTGVGISRLGTSEATAIGAYAFALRRLDERQYETSRD